VTSLAIQPTSSDAIKAGGIANARVISTVAHAPSLASTEPFLYCCNTWHALATVGTFLPNRPAEIATENAIREMQRTLLRPLEEHFGVVMLTYGFAGRELIKAVRKRAAHGGWLPNINPETDQHAGHELNSRGGRICKLDGIAMDLCIPNKSSEDVAQWVIDNHLPFDTIYRYGPRKPFHMSWAPEPRGTVIRMTTKKNGVGLYPQWMVMGRVPAKAPFGSSDEQACR
jgi:hypothetical protein